MSGENFVSSADDFADQARPATSSARETAAHPVSAGTCSALSGTRLETGLPGRAGVGRARCTLFDIRSAWPVAAVAAALLLLTILRLALSAVMPLAPDEAYYWAWSRALAPGYFDHPPMVAL